MPFLRVFWTFLEKYTKEWSVNVYLSSTNHYLQLLYWSHVPKNVGFRVKLAQSLILADFESRKILKSSREINVLRFLRYLAQS